MHWLIWYNSNTFAYPLPRNKVTALSEMKALVISKSVIVLFNPLPDDKIPALSKLKALADDNYNVA